MSNFIRRSLFFSWKLNEYSFREKFRSMSYNPSKNNFDVCDYISQMHSVICMYKFDSLESVLKESDLNVNDFFLQNVRFDSLIPKAVSCLKYTYSLIADFSKQLRYYLKRDSHQIDEHGVAIVLSNSYELAEALPRVDSLNQIRVSLQNALDLFEREKKTSLVEEWIELSIRNIQDQADDLVENMAQMFENGLWDDFENSIKENGFPLASDALKKRLEEFKGFSNNAIQNLRALTEGYSKYIETTSGCYALCIIDGKKYYSLSGIGDYVGNLHIPNFPAPNKPTLLRKLIKILNPGNGFTYAPLNDNVMCYGFFATETYLRESQDLAGYWTSLQISNSKNKQINPRDFSCCERKIMALQRNGKDYKFYIRFEPCFLCLPDLLPEDNKKIVSFIPSNSGCKMLTVRAVLKAPFYELF